MPNEFNVWISSLTFLSCVNCAHDQWGVWQMTNEARSVCLRGPLTRSQSHATRAMSPQSLQFGGGGRRGFLEGSNGLLVTLLGQVTQQLTSHQETRAATKNKIMCFGVEERMNKVLCATIAGRCVPPSIQMRHPPYPPPPPTPVVTVAGSSSVGAAITGGFLGFVAALNLYDIVRRTTCSGDFLRLGGPGFTEPTVGNVMIPRCPGRR